MSQPSLQPETMERAPAILMVTPETTPPPEELNAWMKEFNGPGSTDYRKIILPEGSDHLTYMNRHRGRRELAYQHSAEIVAILELMSIPGPNAQPKPLSFFDTDGNFYNNVTLDLLKLTKAGDLSHLEHTASFVLADTPEEASMLVVPISKIYCVSGATRPLPTN